MVASTTAAGTISQMARGFCSLATKSSSEAGAGGAFAGKLLHGVRAAIVDDAFVAILLQAPHHVGAHSAQTDHAELH